MPSRSSSRLDHDLVDTIGFGEPDVDLLAARRREVLAHVVGTDRQLAVPAIDEHGELDRLRPPEVDEGVHGGAHRPAVKSTSSTRRMRRPSTANGMSVPLTTG